MCKTHPDTDNKDKKSGKMYFTVEGTLNNGKNSILIFQEIKNNDFIFIDTIKTDENCYFKYEHYVNFPTFFALRNGKNDYIIILPEPSEEIIISGNYSFDNYKIENSPHSEIIALSHFKTRGFLTEVSEIAAITRDSINSPNYNSIKIKLASEYDSLFNDLRNYSLELINNNINSPAILPVLFNQPGSGIFVFNPVEDMEIFNKADSILYYLYPDFPPVKGLHEKVMRIKTQQSLKEKLKKTTSNN